MRRESVIFLAGMAALLLSACKDAPGPSASNTAVLGGSGEPRASAVLPAPPAKRGSRPQLAHLGPDETIAVWEEGGDILASRYLPISGWQPVDRLEDIAGQSSLPRIGAHPAGHVMVIWQHTVGRIESLRYSRYEDGKGWSAPDVMPGALPRPRQPGKTAVAEVDLPKIEVDSRGNVRAAWRSGFADGELQVSTFVPGEGWSRPVDVPVASAK